MSRWPIQTRFGGCDAPPGERGDCLSACVAGILGVPLEDVPVFVDLDGDGVWWDAYVEFVSRFGFVPLHFEPSGILGFADGVICVASGPGPRGHAHSVVWVLGGGMIHDPHPSHDGLVGDPTSFDIFVARDPSRQRYR